MKYISTPAIFYNYNISNDWTAKDPQIAAILHNILLKNNIFIGYQMTH